jgi:cytoplasmic iron level regulating protein YaaA (DUF328/UPF0246 family)
MTPTQLSAAAELAKTRQARNGLARDTISAHKLIDELEQIKEKLTDCDPADIQRMMAIANINFGLLKKVLPDIKAIEHKVEEKDAVVVNIDSSQYQEVRKKMLAKVDI